MTAVSLPLPVVGNIELEALGLKEAQAQIDAAMKMMQALGSTFGGVDLHPKTRRVEAGEEAPPKEQNALIVDELIEAGRDFFTPDRATSQAVADELDRELQKRIDEMKRSRQAMTMQAVNGAMAGGLISAMQTYMRAVVARIEAQQTATGSPSPLSPGYAAWKLGKYGFETPIGKATGNLLENLDASNKANIRPRKGGRIDE